MRYCRYCKLAILSTLGMPDYAHPKLYYQLAKNFCLFADKKSTSSHMLFWQYSKDMQTSCFRYFGYAWLHTPKMIVSSGRNVCCLPACLKWPSLFTPFLRYDILKNPAKLYWPTVFCHTILSHNSRTRILQYMVGGEISISK